MPSSLRVLRDFLARPERHRYGPHRCHRADLHVPEGDGPFPVVVLIHGGYWRARYGKSATKPVAADLARRGLAAWNVEYRRLGRRQGGGWPTTFDDIGAAIDQLAELDDDRLELGSVASIGHSAGGQLAFWAAARRDARVPIRAVVGQAPVCDMVSAGEPARELLGGTLEQVPERYAAADPMRMPPLGIPILLVHGPDDESVPLKRSHRFAEAARESGDSVELVEPTPGGHRVHVDPRSRAWAAAAEWVVAVRGGG